MPLTTTLLTVCRSEPCGVLRWVGGVFSLVPAVRRGRKIYIFSFFTHADVRPMRNGATIIVSLVRAHVGRKLANIMFWRFSHKLRRVASPRFCSGRKLVYQHPHERMAARHAPGPGSRRG